MAESKVQDDDCESIAHRERFASNEEKKEDNDDNDDHVERKISDSNRDSLEGKLAHADSSPISVPELSLGAMYHANKGEKECQDDSTDDGDRFFSMSASKDPNSYDPAEDEDAFISSSARKSTKLSLPRFSVGSFMARSTSEVLSMRIRENEGSASSHKHQMGTHRTIGGPRTGSVTVSSPRAMSSALLSSSRSSGLLSSHKFPRGQLMDSPRAAELGARLRSLASRDIPKLSSFVPRQLLTFLEENGNVTLTSQTSHALVMLADISGFTALSENLCSRGPEGVDELSEIISDFLGALIKIVKAYGGDIVAFAGDALIITWVTRPSALVYQTLRVFQCGLELASLTRPQLTLHIGIASGKTHFTIIGGTDGSWNWLVIGEAIVRMGDAEGHASSKEVVVTEETYAPVKEFCNVETIVEEREDSPIMVGSFHRKRGLVKLIGVNMPEELESKADISLVGGNMILSQMSTKFKVTSTSAEAQDNALTAAYTSALSFVDKLRCFIPGPAIEVLRAGERYLNEYRKRICVLFIMLDGFSVDIYDPDSDGKTLAKLFHETLRDLQQVLFSYNGLLRQFLVDDKGCVFIACFGVAGHTHRDDPTRALACGLNMGRILESRKIRSYIGLSTGAAFCGAVGSTDRREYAMVGRDVNLAARLMSLSRKRALQEDRFSMLICNEETYTETKTEPQVEFTALEPVRLKGYENLVQTYLCENRDDDAARRELSFNDSSALAELVGRRDVKEKVSQVASSLVPGKPQVVTICGEQGMGKTLVAIHLKAFLEKRGFQSISCKVFSASQSTPYAVFQQIFWQLLGLDPRADVDIVKHLGTSKLSKEDLDERRKRLFNELMLRVDEYEQALNSSIGFPVEKKSSQGSKGNEANMPKINRGRSMMQRAPTVSLFRRAGSVTLSPSEVPKRRLSNDIAPKRGFLRATTSMFLSAAPHLKSSSKTELVQKASASPRQGQRRRRGSTGSDDYATVNLLGSPRNLLAGQGTDASLGQSQSKGSLKPDSGFIMGVSEGSSSHTGDSTDDFGAHLPSGHEESLANIERSASGAASIGREQSKTSMTRSMARQRRIDRIAQPVLSQILGTQWSTESSRSSEPGTPRRSSLTHHKSLDVFPSQAMVMRCLGRILRVLLRGYQSEGHKLVIFVDDVHYADSLSGKAISELLQSVPGQLLLVFTRQVAMTTAPITQAQGWYKNLCDVVKVTNLNLMPLGRDESLRVIKTAAGDSNLKSNAIDFIIDQGQGNPGRCEEITKSLALSEETELVENTAINVVLERAVQAKFDQLPDTHRALLKTAAVIGFCFPVACLRDIVPRSISRKGDHILAEVIEDLEANDWLESTEGPYGELMYAFRTRLAKDICYNLNTSRNLKMLHLSVAQYYQKTYDEDLRPYFVLLSHHYRRAHNDTMALKFMMYSFRTNIAIGALPEAYAVIEAIPDLNLGAPKLLPALMEMKELVGDDSYFSDGQELAVSQATSDGTGFGPSASSPQIAEGIMLPNDGTQDATHSSMERYTSSAMMSKIEAVRKYVILNRSGDEYEGSSNPTQSVTTEPNESVVPTTIDEANTESGPAPSRACAIL